MRRAYPDDLTNNNEWASLHPIINKRTIIHPNAHHRISTGEKGSYETIHPIFNGFQGQKTIAQLNASFIQWLLRNGSNKPL